MAERFRIIAHRGASADAPENTLPAFRRALEEGAAEVELDVRFSSDLEIVVFHDDALDRKTDREGRVRHYSAAELCRTDIGSWFDRTHPEAGASFAGTCLVTLEEVFAELGSRVRYHVEIKDADALLPLRLMQAVDAHGLAPLVTVTSFSLRPLLEVRKLVADQPVCFLLRDASDALRGFEFRPELEGRSLAEVQAYWIDVASDAGFQQIGVRAADISPACVARAADRGLEVRAWGVRGPDDLRHALALGAVGATVDWPGRARRIVDELEPAA